MATLHPSLPTARGLGAGHYRELDVLRQLADTLPRGFDVFHSVDWAQLLDGTLRVGEVDIAVVSPAGHLMLLEVKAGGVEEDGSALTKVYGGAGESGVSDVGHQVRRNHSAVLHRLRAERLDDVHVATLLVLPDHHLKAGTLAYPLERVVDAAALDGLARRIQDLLPVHAVREAERQRLLDFIGNRFQVAPDVSAHVGQVQRATLALASGLATWVPAIQCRSGLYVVEATAGSGKTQLALTLLQRAHQGRLRSAYVCFNRPLADHMARIAPASADVMTFHEACVNHQRAKGSEPDFAAPGVYQALEAAFVQAAAGLPPKWDLLVLDETQDLAPEWVGALLGLLKEGGSAYLLGDAAQQLYAREGFDLPDAVTIRCNDNFRSPRKVVETINGLALTPTPVMARAAYAGATPGFHTYAAGEVNPLTAVEACLKRLQAEGVAPDHIAVISYAGSGRSQVLRQNTLAGLACRKPTGRFDRAGNAVWTPGELLVETVYRFKGQCAPVVVLCEVDFDSLGPRELSKLFVGFTRAQFRLECVLSERAAQALMARAG